MVLAADIELFSNVRQPMMTADATAEREFYFNFTDILAAHDLAAQLRTRADSRSRCPVRELQGLDLFLTRMARNTRLQHALTFDPLITTGHRPTPDKGNLQWDGEQYAPGPELKPISSANFCIGHLKLDPTKAGREPLGRLGKKTGSNPFDQNGSTTLVTTLTNLELVVLEELYPSGFVVDADARQAMEAADLGGGIGRTLLSEPPPTRPS